MGNGWPIQLKTSLSWPIWAALAAVPLCIVLLYFLKLKRQSVVVPSTLLWRRSMEDLRVNSLFQRLRRNILLIMQLLTVAMILLALTGPSWVGSSTSGRRLIIAIDQSASMSATDVAPNRLSVAKSKATALINSMTASDLAMIIAFSDTAEVVSSYTSNKNLLKQKIQAIEPTERRTNLREALQVADGLANPSRQTEGGIATAESTPKLVILTDGAFADIQGFSLGNLEPELIVIGQGPPEFKPGQNEEKTTYPTNNLAVLTMQARRNEESPNTIEVFGRLKNYDSADNTTELKLFRLPVDATKAEQTLIDALKITVPGESEKGFQFTIADTGAQALMIDCQSNDLLKTDNIAYAVVPPDRKPSIRLVSSGNRYLSQYFRSPGVKESIEYSEITPEDLKKPEIQREFSLGKDALTIFDRCAPEIAPQNHSLYFGAFPPGKKFAELKAFQNPTILDWDTASPLMQYLRDLTVIRIRDVRIPEPLPAGARPLIESDKGPVAVTSPRDGFMDVIIGFHLSDEKSFNTDWFLKYSFPLFLSNTIQHLAGVGSDSVDGMHRPGESFSIAAGGLVGKSLAIESLITNSKNTDSTTNVDSSGRIAITAQGFQGAFSVKNEKALVDLFTVDLFDDQESNLATRGLAPVGAPGPVAEKYQLKIGFTPIAGTSKSAGLDAPLWKSAVALGLILLIAEWFIYNRRVAI
jgi:hypothetical protein